MTRRERWIPFAFLIPALAGLLVFQLVPIFFGLGRSLFIHLQRPLPEALLAQGLVVTAIALPVILTAYRQKRRG